MSTSRRTLLTAALGAGAGLMREHGVLNRILLVYEESIRRLGAERETLRSRRSPRPPTSSGASSRTTTRSSRRRFLFPRFEKAGKLADVWRSFVGNIRAGSDADRTIDRSPPRGLHRRTPIAAARRDDAAIFIRMYRPHEAREDTVLFPSLRETSSDAEGVRGAGRAVRGQGARAFRRRRASRGSSRRSAKLEQPLGIGDLASSRRGPPSCRGPSHAPTRARRAGRAVPPARHDRVRRAGGAHRDDGGRGRAPARLADATSSSSTCSARRTSSRARTRPRWRSTSAIGAPAGRASSSPAPASSSRRRSIIAARSPGPTSRFGTLPDGRVACSTASSRSSSRSSCRRSWGLARTARCSRASLAVARARGRSRCAARRARARRAARRRPRSSSRGHGAPPSPTRRRRGRGAAVPSPVGACRRAARRGRSLWRALPRLPEDRLVLFGSGYVLLAFLRADLVERWHWLTEAQLLDAVAVGQVTPGPVFTTATFVGYLARRRCPARRSRRSASSCRRSSSSR